MSKPIVCFDCETTGKEPTKDRIVSICLKKFESLAQDSPFETLSTLINPCMPIPGEATEIHGITDEMVHGKPKFREYAPIIEVFVANCDLAGYNIANFDITILWEELFRSGITWDMTGVQIIDPCQIFHKKEKRDLESAMKFFCGLEHADAHGAEPDTDAAWKVLRAQIARYADLSAMDVEGLAKFSTDDLRRFDFAGKLVIDEDDEPVYNFGKDKGQKVRHNPGFADWMLRNDFPTQTKMVLRAYLKTL